MARQRGVRSFSPMPTYLIEREIPGARNLTDEELRGITAKSNDVVASLERPYEWCHSYVAGDKIYCVHEAESAEVILEHASAAASRPTWWPRSRRSSTAPARARFRSEPDVDSRAC